MASRTLSRYGARLDSRSLAYPSFNRPPPRAAFTTTSRRRYVEPQNQRYGTANEPPPHLGGSKLVPPSSRKEAAKEGVGAEVNRAASKPEAKETQREGTKLNPAQKKSASVSKTPEAASKRMRTESKDATTETVAHPIDSSSKPILDPTTPVSQSTSASDAMSSILAMPPPMSDKSNIKPSSSHPLHPEQTASSPSTTSEANADSQLPPHLEPPPFVHHFDTYTLVKSLQPPTETAGSSQVHRFNQTQSIILMKAVRTLLSQNMDLARQGILSRADFEMDAHQFRAAAAELRTEVRQRRQASTERMRAERNQLQHEVDILSQRLSQEMLALKDEVRGMFDDRRMSTRAERRRVENAIQELNYKITVALNSEMRNEVEGLRFILTRRTVLGLGLVVLLSLAFLRASASAKKKGESAQGKGAEGGSGEGGKPGDGAGHGEYRSDKDNGGNELTSQEIAKRVEEGENPGLISLG